MRLRSMNLRLIKQQCIQTQWIEGVATVSRDRPCDSLNHAISLQSPQKNTDIGNIVATLLTLNPANIQGMREAIEGGIDLL